MSGPRLRALVLAAGYGRRLGPLTTALPKPLLPVLGQPLIGHTLDRLARLRCEACAVNLHHLADQIPSSLGVSWQGMPLHYSREPQLLGTLGAAYPVRELLGRGDLVLVVNGDSLCRWPLGSLIRHHRRRQAKATLLLARSADPAEFGGGIGVDDEGRICDLSPSAPSPRATARRVFAGAQVWSTELLERVPDGVADTVTDLYRPLLREGAELASLTTRRTWADLGTPERYLSALLARARRSLQRRWVAAEATVAGSASIRRSVVERRAVVAERAKVSGSVVLGGSRIGEGSELEGVIVGGGVELPEGSRVAHRLITPARAGEAAPEGSSLVGPLLYTPLRTALR